MKIERDADRPGKWKVDVTIAGRRIREHGFKSRTAVEELVTDLRSKAKRKKYGLEHDRPSTTVERLLEERISDIDLDTSRGRWREKILRSFVASLSEGRLVAELSRADLHEWTRVLRGRKLKPGTVNRYLSEVSAMLEAVPSMFAGFDDWRRPKFPWQKTRGVRGSERIISREEKRALLDELRFPKSRVDGKGLRPADVAARRDVADCFELALLTAMRGIEVRSLEWTEVDFAEAEVHLPGEKTKSGEPRDIPLNARALEILRRREATRRSARGDERKRFSRFVFPNEKGDGPRPEISRVVRPVARALGLRYGANVPGGFRPHSTRHTATTEMVRAGVDYKTVQDVTGHSDRIMVLRYSHSTRASRRRAVELLGELESKRGR